MNHLEKQSAWLWPRPGISWDGVTVLIEGKNISGLLYYNQETEIYK